MRFLGLYILAELSAKVPMGFWALIFIPTLVFMLVGVLGQLVLSLKTIVVKTTRTILMSSKHAYVMISPRILAFRLFSSWLFGRRRILKSVEVSSTRRNWLNFVLIMNKFVVAVLSMIVLRINRLLNISRW